MNGAASITGSERADDAPPSPFLKGDGRDVHAWQRIIKQATEKADKDSAAFDKYPEIFEHGQFKNNKDGNGNTAVSVNQVFSYISMMTALEYSQSPAIEVEAREGGDASLFTFPPQLMQLLGVADPVEARRKLAEAMELYATYSHAFAQSDEAANVAIFYAHLTGLSVSKIGFDPEYGIEVEDALLRTEVYFDPGARYSMRQCGYVIHTTDESIDQARVFFQRKGVNPSLIQPNWKLSEGKGLLGSYGREVNATEQDRFRYHEIWCRKEGKDAVYYLPYRNDNFLDCDENWPFKLPKGMWNYVPLHFNRKFRGLGDAFSELAVTDGLRQMMEETMEFYRRTARRGLSKKILLDEDAFTDEDVKAILDGRNMVARRIKKGGKAWNELVHVMSLNDKADPSLEVAGVFEQAAEKVLGMNELEQAGRAKKLTATQAELMDEYGKVRTGRRQKIIDGWRGEIQTVKAQIARQLVDPNVIGSVVGRQEQMLWQMYAGNAEDFNRQFSFGIQAGSTGERAKQIRIERAKEFLTLAQQRNASLAAQMQPPRWDEDALMMEVLRANNVRRPERYYIEPPPPMPAPAIDPATGQPIQDPNVVPTDAALQPAAAGMGASSSPAINPQPQPVNPGGPAAPVPPGGLPGLGGLAA